MREGCAVVVSPLIALMQDQVAALTEAGVNAAVLNSSLDAQAAYQTERDFTAGWLDLLYVPPAYLPTVKPRFCLHCGFRTVSPRPHQHHAQFCGS